MALEREVLWQHSPCIVAGAAVQTHGGSHAPSGSDEGILSKISGPMRAGIIVTAEIITGILVQIVVMLDNIRYRGRSPERQGADQNRDREYQGQTGGRDEEHQGPEREGDWKYKLRHQTSCSK